MIGTCGWACFSVASCVQLGSGGHAYRGTSVPCADWAPLVGEPRSSALCEAAATSLAADASSEDERTEPSVTAHEHAASGSSHRARRPRQVARRSELFVSSII